MAGNTTAPGVKTPVLIHSGAPTSAGTALAFSAAAGLVRFVSGGLTMQAAVITDVDSIASPPLRAAALPVLTVVIPALNEEEAIGSTIQRCLDARERICRVGR